jgi:hypothetical protein
VAPVRLWRPMVLWTAGILLALGLTWSVGAVLVPILQVRAAIKECAAEGVIFYHGSRPTFSCDPSKAAPTILRLGGDESAARKLAFYVQLPSWLNGRSQGDDSFEKSFAMLSRCGGPGLEVLMRLARSQDLDIRLSALYALADMGPEAKPASDLLLEAIAEDRYYVVLALGCWKSEAVDFLPALIAAVQRPNGHSRWQALNTLRCIGPAAQAAVPALTEALKDDDDRVRRGAAEALQEIQGKEPDATPKGNP